MSRTMCPWDEDIIRPSEFDVCVSQTLSKNCTVTTENYVYDTYEDEDGKHCFRNTEGVDWKEVYNDNYHYTPLELINKFKETLEAELSKYAQYSKEYKRLMHLISECSNWVEDETEIVR